MYMCVYIRMYIYVHTLSCVVDIYVLLMMYFRDF